jgi:hypothetical protein
VTTLGIIDQIFKPILEDLQLLSESIAVTLNLRAIPQEDEQSSFQSLLDRATRCIDAEGMYFE